MPPPSCPDPTASCPSPRVLVVEEDSSTRERYRTALAASGCMVFEAADGRDALVQVYSTRPDVVMLDARLPYIDGLELVALLRSESTTAGLRVVAIASDSATESAERFHEFGADAVLAKPVALEALVSSVLGAERPAGQPRHTETAGRSTARVRAHERYASTEPPLSPPHVRCPTCDAVLQYEHSQVGGVSDRHPEQWDYYSCAVHGTFQYRHRTRRLRPVP